jgi:hypothetical protein
MVKKRTRRRTSTIDEKELTFDDSAERRAWQQMHEMRRAVLDGMTREGRSAVVVFEVDRVIVYDVTAELKESTAALWRCFTPYIQNGDVQGLNVEQRAVVDEHDLEALRG